MKRITGLLLLLSFVFVQSHGQGNTNSSGNTKPPKNMKTALGVKAGYVWSYATADQAGVNLNSKSGYMLGVFLSPPRTRVVGYRTEFVFSRQGYSYDDGGKNTSILNDYIYFPQLTTFSIGKVFQLQIGGQIGYLVNAKKTSATTDSSVANLMNRLDYGFAAGFELNPVGGLIIGSRYNLGLGKLYKQYQSSSSGGMPYPLPFNPQTTNLKNGTIHVYVGFTF
ncbi:MAG: hypothetical protein NVS1B13_11150 [Flavisolibacter sp.]